MEMIVGKLLDHAIDEKISDIHLVKKGEKISMTYRGVNGLAPVDGEVPSSLLSYLLYLAKLDISFKSKPQTGMFNHYHNYKRYFIRVAMMQSFENLSVVLRILNQYRFKKFNDLCENWMSVKKLESLLDHEYGIIAFSGPTGSGKTTTAYTLLNQFDNRAIYTIEDPIEINFENLVQIQVNEQLGFGFEQGIKHILRHDPDIIFIGEIRDSNSAKMAVRCALSGHLVVVTVHSATTYSTLNRFLDFGVNRQDLTEVMKVIVNQRLYYESQRERYLANYDILDKEEILDWLNKE